MALNKFEGGAIYLSVANGQLVRQHKEANKETKERENKQGRIVHEEFFKDLTGIITAITTKENNYGKQWLVTFTDGGDKYIVQMPYSSRYSSSFLKALPNLSQGQPVRFMPWEMQDKKDAAKKITGITLYQDQDGNGMTKVPSAYTKEDPNGLPEMKKVKIKGKLTWDDSDMMTFLEEMANDWMKSAPVVTDEQAAQEEPPF